MIFALLIDIASRIFMLTIKYNLFLIPIFGLMELFLFSFIYYKYIFRTYNKIALAVIIVAIVVVVQDLFFREKLFDPSRFNSFGKVVSDLVILFAALLHIFRSMNSSLPFRKDYLILSFVLLFYFSINMLFTVAINFLVNEKMNIVFAFWAINLIFTLLFYIALSLLIWQNGRIRKSLQ